MQKIWQSGSKTSAKVELTRKVQTTLFSMFKNNKKKSASSNVCTANMENELRKMLTPSEKVKRSLNEFGEGIGPYNTNLPALDSESSKPTNGKRINPVSIKSKDSWAEGSIME